MMAARINRHQRLAIGYAGDSVQRVSPIKTCSCMVLQINQQGVILGGSDRVRHFLRFRISFIGGLHGHPAGLEGCGRRIAISPPREDGHRGQVMVPFVARRDPCRLSFSGASLATPRSNCISCRQASPTMCRDRPALALPPIGSHCPPPKQSNTWRRGGGGGGGGRRLSLRVRIARQVAVEQPPTGGGERG